MHCTHVFTCTVLYKFTYNTLQYEYLNARRQGKARFAVRVDFNFAVALRGHVAVAILAVLEQKVGIPARVCSTLQ